MSGRHAGTGEAFGSTERADDGWRLSFVREYPHPPERVWAMLTDPALTRLWWADARIDGREGGRFDLRWLNTPEAGEWWTGEILAWEPPRHLELTNSEHGVLGWLLTPTGAGTRLEFRDTIRPEEESFVAMSLAGWHLHLDHLSDALGGTGQDWDGWLETWLPHWRELHAEYRRRNDLP
ncbi:MAG: SRPBCC family protein [Leifsonia sp.]